MELPSEQLKYQNLDDLLRARKVSPAELEVARRILQGKYNTEIALELSVCEKTVKWHITSLFRKLDVRSRITLALYCVPYLAQEITEENCIQFQGLYSSQRLPSLLAGAGPNLDQTSPSTSL